MAPLPLRSRALAGSLSPLRAPLPHASRIPTAGNLDALRRMHLLGAAGAPGERLTGGVSSDIWRIDLPDGPICVKRALAKLRVAADWHAPVERNRYEAAWMQPRQCRRPRHCPRPARPGRNQRRAGDAIPVPRRPSAMEDATARRPRRSRFRRAGRDVAGAHPCRHRRRSRPPPRNSPPTASSSTSAWSPICSPPRARTPISRRACEALVAATQHNKRALVHGDVSPKNILAGPRGPVFLDAECAWWGDPAFDLAFCLNHLLLKCLWTPAATSGFLGCFDALAARLSRRRHLGTAGGRWKPARRGCCRACSSPGWMASRRSSTSPRAADKDRVRRTARALLRDPPDRLADDAPGLEQGTRRMTDSAIAYVHGRRVWDSRGRPTVETDILLEGGGVGRAIAPGGRLHRHRRGARPARRRRGVRRL